jgi:hypothetical protein
MIVKLKRIKTLTNETKIKRMKTNMKKHYPINLDWRVKLKTINFFVKESRKQNQKNIDQIENTNTW